MTDCFVAFYTRPADDGSVGVMVVIEDVEHVLIECRDRAEALALIDQLVEVGLEKHGGLKVYSREQRN